MAASRWLSCHGDTMEIFVCLYPIQPYAFSIFQKSATAVFYQAATKIHAVFIHLHKHAPEREMPRSEGWTACKSRISFFRSRRSFRAFKLEATFPRVRAQGAVSAPFSPRRHFRSYGLEGCFCHRANGTDSKADDSLHLKFNRPKSLSPKAGNMETPFCSSAENSTREIHVGEFQRHIFMKELLWKLRARICILKLNSIRGVYLFTNCISSLGSKSLGRMSVRVAEKCLPTLLQSCSDITCFVQQTFMKYIRTVGEPFSMETRSWSPLMFVSRWIF